MNNTIATFITNYRALTAAQQAATTLTLDDGATPPLPDAEAPTLSVSANPTTITHNQTSALTITLGTGSNAGTYDTITYSFTDAAAGQFTGAGTNRTYNPASVTSQQIRTITVTATVQGDGTTATSGTSAAVDATVDVTVNPTTTTDTDSRYRLAATQPATPTGGTGSENHVPAGWTTTEPAPTETQAVWRTQRTRTFTGGTFTSATAWGTPTQRAGILLALSDWVTPADQENVFVAVVEIGNDSGTNVFLYDANSSVGSIEDGDMDIGTNFAFDRIWLRSPPTSRAQFQRRAAGDDAQDLFETGGDYADGTIWVQDGSGATGVVMADIAATDVQLRGINIYNTQTGGIALLGKLNGLTDGDRIIVAFTNPAPQAIATLEANGLVIIDPLPAGTNRTITLRTCIQGTFGDGTEGLQVLWRPTAAAAWIQGNFIHGWAYSDSYETGDSVTDENGVARTIAADGGWIDVDTSIPDNAGQVGLQPRYILPGAQDQHTHDIAIRSVSWS